MRWVGFVCRSSFFNVIYSPARVVLIWLEIWIRISKYDYTEKQPDSATYFKGFWFLSTMSKSYKILHTVETVSLDDGVEAITQPSKPRSFVTCPWTRRKKGVCIVISSLLVVVILCLIAVTIALVVVVAQRRESGSGVGPTHQPPQCAQVPSVHLACSYEGAQPTSERECAAVGCCWNNSLATPCFSEHPNTCPSSPTDRLSCSSDEDIRDEAECTGKGCCWDDRNPQTSCFHPFIARCPTDNVLRFNCIPETVIDQSNVAYASEQCIQRACCWNASSDVKCAFTLDYGYMVTDGYKTPNGYSLTLVQKSNQPSLYGHDVRRLKVNATFETETRLHVQVVTCMHTHTHTQTYTHKHTHTHTHTHTHIYTHRHTRTHTHTHRHTRTHTHTNTHTHTHGHTQTHTSGHF